MGAAASAGTSKVLIVAVAGLACAVGAMGYTMATRSAPPTEPAAQSNDGGLQIGYADSAVVLEADDLQKRVDEMNEQTAEGSMRLQYKNDALSSDGTSFACFINNADTNRYDMYIAIYSDAQYTDELFLSGLIRPGEGFDNVTLNRELDEGTHRLFVAFTQVKTDENGEQTIAGQNVVTMDFTVQH